MSVAALAFQCFLLHNLTTGLMFELVIFAEITITEAALKYSPSVVPDVSLTFNALSIPANAATGVGLKALLAVANPSLAKITDSSNHLHPSRVLPWMSDDTISRPHHTLLFATGSADGKSLNRIAKVTKGSVFLLQLALIALHHEVTGIFYNLPLLTLDVLPLHTELHLLSLLTLTRFLFGHFDI